MEIKKGIFLTGVFNEDYHQAEGVSNSQLSEFAKSPAHYLALKEQGYKPDTPAQRIGRIFHSWILDGVEPVVAPKVDRRTKAGREAYSDFVSENKGKEVITQDEQETMLAMVEAIRSHSVAGPLLSGGLAEQSLWFTNQETGLLCKCRPDYLNGDTVVDLKTAVDAGKDGFARAVFNYRYYIQNAFYMDGISSVDSSFKRFVFVVIEKAPPFAIGVYELEPAAVLQGRKTYKQELWYLAECIENDNFPGYSQEIITLSLPRWAQEDQHEMF